MVRKLSGLLLVMLLSLLLAACGSEDSEPTEAAIESPTAEATADAEPTEEEVAVVEASAGATAVGDSSPTSAVVPIDEATGATPDAVGTPVVAASRAGTPMATPAVSASPEASGTTVSLSGQVVLTGAENEAYILSDEGCAGLGEHSDMQVGRQVVVRDESARIVGVTTLDRSDAGGCAWTFSLEVPESEFYSVAVPMKTEMVFTQQEVSAGNGDLVVPLP